MHREHMIPQVIATSSYRQVKVLRISRKQKQEKYSAVYSLFSWTYFGDHSSIWWGFVGIESLGDLFVD